MSIQKLLVLGLLVVMVFWGTIGYVAWHFIAMYW